MNMVGHLKTLSWRPLHWIYQHHYWRLQWNARSCKPNLEAIQDDLGPGSSQGIFRIKLYIAKIQGSPHKINQTLWKYQEKTYGKIPMEKKVRLNKIYRIHPAQILKSFKVGQLQPNRTVLGWFRSNREQNLQTRMLAPFTYCKPRTLSIICWSSTLKSVSTKEMMGTIKKHQNKLDLVSSSSNSGRFEASDLSIAGYRQRWISVCSRQKNGVTV